MAKGANKKNDSKKPTIRFKVLNVSIEKGELFNLTNVDFKNHGGFKYQLDADVNLNSEKSLISVLVKYSFYKDQQLLLDLIVRNDFQIDDNKLFLPSENIHMYDNFFAFILDISISHTRGMQASIINNTPLSGFYMPIILRDRLKENLKPPVSVA